MHAKEFFERADPGEARTHLLDLLYGTDPLEPRLRRFLDWSKPRQLEGGKRSGINATTAGYLLAMSAPERYAFCKPEVYNAAAATLLGPEHSETNTVRRLLQGQQLYAKALELFRGKHKLPFSDLLHAHIAFFVMQDKRRKEPGYPTWEQLGATPVSISPPGTAVPVPDLNIILYGPPGTGKTYQTMTRAVQICDGEVPADRGELVRRFRKLQDERRIGFVTFHQAYGYEEFIEGIRPVLRDGDAGEAGAGEIEYECADGIFKQMCSMARQAEQGGTRSGGTIDLSGSAVWKMSLGNTTKSEDAGIYDACIEGDVIWLGYGRGLDFTGCDTIEAVEAKHREHDPQIAPNDFSITSLDRFKNKMKVGDLVVISDGNRKFRAIGRVTGEYRFVAGRDGEYGQERPVEWLLVLEESLPRDRILRRDFSQATIYQLRDRVLNLDALSELLSESDGPGAIKNYVLIIDEINRGNISKVLGELITLLEPDKRIGGPNELRVTLPYSRDPFGVPANLFVIGTMNTADRSIAIVDAALRRRFAFEEVMPDYAVIREHVGKDGDVDGVDVAAFLECVNERIEALFDRDHQIGHAAVLDVRSLADLREVVGRRIIPLLQEYFHGDWSKVCLVLGCPYDPETGRPTTKNAHPLVRVSRHDSSLFGGSPGEPDARCRGGVNPAFLTAAGAELASFFSSATGPSGAARGGGGDGKAADEAADGP